MDRRRIAAMVAAAGRGARGPRLNDAATVFLSQSTLWNDYAQLSNDLSANNVDLTNATSHAHLNPHAPTSGLVNGRTVELLMQLVQDGTTSYAIVNGDGTFAGGKWSVYTASTTALRCAGASAVTQVSGTVRPATRQRFYVAWSEDVNPSTTGPSDARLSTLHVWNVDADTYAAFTGAHAVTEFNAADRFILGAANAAGGNLFAASGQRIGFARISNRARTREQIEAVLPQILAASPYANPLAAGQIFRPRLSNLIDPLSGITGTNDGTTYDSGNDTRDFNGTTDRLDWATPFRPNASDPYTISAWLYADSLTNNPRIWTTRQSGGAAGPFVDILSDGRVRLYNTNGSSPDLHRAAVAGSLTTGSWQHVTVTNDGSNTFAGVRIYKSGAELSYATGNDGGGTPRAANLDWALGGNFSSDATCFDGRIAKFSAWNRALSPTEVASNYASQAAPA
jgi:hypothetical protein